jgi:hypothetical protein
MASIGNRVLDNGLTVLDTEANALHICSQEPTTYTEAVTTYTLGNKTTYSSGSPSDRGGGGREVTFASITDGSVTGTNTATHFAVVDTVNSRLLVTQAFSSSQSVTSGNTFTLTSFTVGIPDPA